MEFIHVFPDWMGHSNEDIIRAIRAYKTAAEERAAVRKECASSLLSFLDLNHTNQYIVGLALCALGNTCSAEMARDLAPEVERLLQFRDPNIQKKKCTEVLVKVLKDVVNNAYAPEYDVSGIADPFLRIRLLRLLHVLGHGDADASDSMNHILT
ncbi:unnamed protein product [Lactuca saligna]|uniref:Clathrin/coatomer adaptor adaptin-like N-terminal domain-containing protein n=1 Tax=Lactuca saligna TaxID=75948 RepID=A0AA35ZI63_LACSI|nr:unnamed protein product [Lactuca saligna]